MENNLQTDSEYRSWIGKLKQKYQQTQIKASISVNTHLLSFYWELGLEIVERQKSTQWGSGFLQQLSADLIAEFPETKGFSYNNLTYIKRWYLFYNQPDSSNPTASEKVAQLVPLLPDPNIANDLVKIPWGHNRMALT